MRLRVGGLALSLECPDGFRIPRAEVFACGDCPDSPALDVLLRVARSVPVPPLPDYTLGETAFVAAPEGGLLAWNVFDRGADGSALLRLADRAHAEIVVGRRILESSLYNMLNLAYLPVFCREGGVRLHSSLVELNGRMVAFVGSSGVGKTTQAELWSSHLAATIANGDCALVRRVRGEWLAYGSPWGGSSPYIRNASAPLATLVLLEQAPENHIERLAPEEVLGLLYRHVNYPTWDAEATAALLGTLDRLVREVPVYHLSCRPDREAVLLARDAALGGA